LFIPGVSFVALMLVSDEFLKTGADGATFLFEGCVRANLA